MKDRLYEKVKKYIAAQGMIAPGDLVAAGVSGGADSVCLLHLLRRLKEELPFRLAAVHVNHGLREEAGEDAAFVEELCGQWGIPFFLREADVSGYVKRHGVSTEEAGRHLRYQAFAEVLAQLCNTERQMGETGEPICDAGRQVSAAEKQFCDAGRQMSEAEKPICDAEKRFCGAGKIAVAHNAEDRAETMLFHLFRGSGLRGLASIRPVRGAVVRPLLCAGRAEIEGYLAAWGLPWREDRTNGEDVYARNRIRHHILPCATEQICQGAVAHMGELADILWETERYLERETKRLYAKYAVEESGAVVGQAEKGTQVASGQLAGKAENETEQFVEKVETGKSLEEEERTEFRAGQPAEANKNRWNNPANAVHIKLDGLAEEDIVMQKRLFLHALSCLTPHRKDISSRHIAALLALTKTGGSKELSLPDGIRARKEYDSLRLERARREVKSNAGAKVDAGGGAEAAEAALFGAEMTETEWARGEPETDGALLGTEAAAGAEPPSLPEIAVETAALLSGESVEVAAPGAGRLVFRLWEASSLPGDFPFSAAKNASQAEGRDAAFSKKKENIPENGYTKWFDYDKITKSLVLRPRKAGDYFTIDEARHTQSVRRYMMNEKIPKEKRDGIYLLTDGSHVLWAPGRRDSWHYRVGADTKRILEVRLF